MKRRAYNAFLAVSTLAGVFWLAGCDTVATTNPGVVKNRGIYTTVAQEGQSSDMAASDLPSSTNFTAIQIPEVVITGYGFPDGTPQPFDLQVVETAGETIVFTNSGSAAAGKVALIELPISYSGKYQARLLINDYVQDAWDFAVKRDATTPREVAAPGLTNSPASSATDAKNNIEVVVGPWGGGDIFGDYDDDLNKTLTAAVADARKAHPDVFSEGTPGHVIIRFDMDEKGQVSSPQIIGNTLSDAFGQFFLSVLQTGSPYKPWSTVVKTVYGDHPRTMKVTFYID
jgi:hypothetical protein